MPMTYSKKVSASPPSVAGFTRPFAQRSPTDPWAFTALCVCGQTWANHEMLEDSNIPPTPAIDQRPQHLRVPPPLTGLLTSSLPAPVTMFAARATPLAAAAATSSIAAPITSSGAASANHSRNTAIARHFPRPKYKPPRPYPTSGNSTASFKVLIALWPNVMPGSTFERAGQPIFDFSYTIDEFTEMLLKLKAHGLTFAATLPSADQSNIVEELTAQLLANLVVHGLVLPAAAGSSADNSDGTTLWFRLPWLLLEPTRRKTVYTFHQHAKANSNNFNRKMILAMNSKFTNPDTEHGDIPLIVLAPRFGPVQGPLPDSLPLDALANATRPQELHSCYSQRLLHGLPHSGGAHDLECIDNLCPEEDPPTFIPQPLLPPRRTNPPRLAMLNQRLAAAPVVIPAQLRLATGSEITDWQQNIWMDVGSVPDSQTVYISGTNITAMAEYIISIFHHLRLKELDPSSSSTFPTPSSIVNPRTTMTHLSFLQVEMFRSYSVGRLPVEPSAGRRVAGSVGRGVEHAVWRHVLSLMAEDGQFWRAMFLEPDHVTFVLSRVASPERVSRFYTYGQLIALHLYYYGHGLSIGLWPVLAIALGRKSMLLGEAFLRLISPGIASELKPWFALRPEDPIPTSLTHPVSGLIMELLDTQPSLLPSVRTKIQHDDLTVDLLSNKLFGCEPWEQPDFMALSAGFDMRLSLQTDITFAHAACLIAGMYRRQIQSLDDVLGHLDFTVLSPTTAAPEVALMRQLFELRFKRYLGGQGHPRFLREHGLVTTDEEMLRGAATPFLRAQLLLLTALESSLLPVNDSWVIRIQSSSAGPAAARAPPLGLHTCSGGIDVHVNAKLFDLMIKSPEGDEETDFDIWAHTQIYNADLAYNIM
ncbi:hypothetical protein C8R44DRAFT_751454 [Mycena epipterygia]|nr:hypothetical protein C8R44DRAFT_751454 [Mycena epipterygia]